MSKFTLAAVGATVALVAALASSALAENARRNSPVAINGTTKDALGRPIENALVFLQDNAGKTVAQTKSGQLGEFRLEAPSTGTYAILTTKGGFKPTTR